MIVVVAAYHHREALRHYAHRGRGCRVYRQSCESFPASFPNPNHTRLTIASVAQGANFGRRKSSFVPLQDVRPDLEDAGDRFVDEAQIKYTVRRGHCDSQVSPPSSPELVASRYVRCAALKMPGDYTDHGRNDQLSERSVSPLDSPDMSRSSLREAGGQKTQISPRLGSSIPTLRREKRRQQAANAGRLQQQQQQTWDSYSNESQQRQIHRPTGLPLGNISHISANHASFGERMKKAKATSTTERPAWQGASGRQTVVPPVQERVNASRTLAVKQKPVVEVNPPYSPRTIPPDDNDNDDDTTIQRNFHEALRGIHLPSLESGYVQPPSRFSVTTYSPSETQSSPRPSLDSFNIGTSPPVPQIPFEAPSSILNRSRPRFASDSPATIKATTRKALPSTATIHINMRSSIATSRPTARPDMERRDSSSPTDTEAETGPPDVIRSLQDQLDELQSRRSTITKSIQQLTELMPTDHVFLTDAVKEKREGEKKKIEHLRSEEADVRRAEYDLGLRLHRAWKRQVQGSVYEPTGLWVRRVTE